MESSGCWESGCQLEGHDKGVGKRRAQGGWPRSRAGFFKGDFGVPGWGGGWVGGGAREGHGGLKSGSCELSFSKLRWIWGGLL